MSPSPAASQVALQQETGVGGGLESRHSEIGLGVFSDALTAVPSAPDLRLLAPFFSARWCSYLLYSTAYTQSFRIATSVLPPTKVAIESSLRWICDFFSCPFDHIKLEMQSNYPDLKSLEKIPCVFCYRSKHSWQFISFFFQFSEIDFSYSFFPSIINLKYLQFYFFKRRHILRPISVLKSLFLSPSLKKYKVHIICLCPCPVNIAYVLFHLFFPVNSVCQIKP